MCPLRTPWFGRKLEERGRFSFEKILPRTKKGTAPCPIHTAMIEDQCQLRSRKSQIKQRWGTGANGVGGGPHTVFILPFQESNILLLHSILQLSRSTVHCYPGSECAFLRRSPAQHSFFTDPPPAPGNTYACNPNDPPWCRKRQGGLA